MQQLYHYLLGPTPSKFTQKLLQNFSLTVSGFSIATAITFGFNILAARLMGPEEFGKWNIIGSAAEFFVVIPLWGMTAAVLKYLGSEKEKSHAIIGASFKTVIMLSVLIFPIYFALGPWLEKVLGLTDASFFGLIMIYAGILILFYLFQSYFQGMGEFKRLSVLWIISALVFVCVVSIFLFIVEDFSFASLYWGNVSRLSLVILAGLIIFRKSLFKFGFNSGVFKETFHYGSYHMLSFVAGFFSLGMIDNLMINYYLGPGAVGLYAAYYAAFSIFIGRILSIFSQVFLPMASGYGNISELYSGAIVFTRRTGIIIFVGILGLIWVLFQFYGQAFVFDIGLALLMSLSIVLYSFLMVLGNIIAAAGIKGAKIGVIFAIISAVINVLLNVALIPYFQLFGSIIATITATLVVIAAAIYVIKFKLKVNEQSIEF